MLSDLIHLQLDNGETLPVRWVRSARARHLRLSLTQAGPRVTTPVHAPRHFVERFVAEHREWLTAHMQRRESLKTNEILFLGKEYFVEVSAQPLPGGERVVFDGNHMRIHPVQPTAHSATRLLDRWLQTQATDVCAPLIREIAPQMHVAVPTLKFRAMTSRWGSCSAHGTIMLNWRLVHAPVEVIRYVVVHELSHRIHLNHSTEFWKLVMQYDPDFRIHRGWLKRHGHQCATPEIVIAATHSPADKRPAHGDAS